VVHIFVNFPFQHKYTSFRSSIHSKSENRPAGLPTSLSHHMQFPSPLPICHPYAPEFVHKAHEFIQVLLKGIKPTVTHDFLE